MTAEPGADERRIRSLLRRRGVGPDAHPPAPSITAAREPDWLDEILTDEQPMAEPAPPWWSIRKDPAPAPPVAAPAHAPGVHVTITPTATPADHRRARIRWWVLRRGTAAGVGWLLGLGHWVQDGLSDSDSAVVLALLLWLIAWYAAVRILRLVPDAAVQEVRDAVDWAAHLPDATILLALALHTPGALL